MSATALAGLGLTSAPVLASPSGYLHPDAIADASPDTTLLVTSDAVGVEAPTVADVGGREVLLTSATAVDGGPGPDDRLATVALRQRVLAEAAVRAARAPGREPLVVTLPTDWSHHRPGRVLLRARRRLRRPDVAVGRREQPGRPRRGARLPAVPAGLRARRRQLHRRRGPHRRRRARCSRSSPENPDRRRARGARGVRRGVVLAAPAPQRGPRLRHPLARCGSRPRWAGSPSTARCR